MTRPIVLLHGWGLSAAVWTPLRARLDPATPIHAPDLPGHGNAAPAGTTLASWAEALLPAIPDGKPLLVTVPAIACSGALGLVPHVGQAGH